MKTSKVINNIQKKTLKRFDAFNTPINIGDTVIMAVYEGRFVKAKVDHFTKYKVVCVCIIDKKLRVFYKNSDRLVVDLRLKVKNI